MIVSNAFLDRLIFLFIGMLIGLTLGVSHRIMFEYLKQIVGIDKATKAKVDKLMESQKPKEDGAATVKSMALGFVVVVTAFSAIGTGIVNSRLSGQQDRIQNTQTQITDIQRCTEVSLGNLLESLNGRTSLTAPLNTADDAQNRALSKLLTLILTNPPPSPAEGRKAVKDWSDKLDLYLSLLSKQRDTQTGNPIPTSFGFDRCLEEANKNEVQQ